MYNRKDIAELLNTISHLKRNNENKKAKALENIFNALPMLESKWRDGVTMAEYAEYELEMLCRDHDDWVEEFGYQTVEEHIKDKNTQRGDSKNTLYGISVSSIGNYLKLFDNNEQIDILQEECAELIVALSKYKRNPTYTTKCGIIEEMSHVLISSAMVSRIHNITQTDIDNEVAKKDTKYKLFNLRRNKNDI